LNEKEKIIRRMSQLDPNPFWDQHRNRLIPNSIFTPAGNEEKGALSNILFAIQSISYVRLNEGCLSRRRETD